MASDIFKFSGARALHYDNYLGPFLFEPYGKAMAERVAIKGIQSVLELAAGTGRVTRHLREQLPPSVRLIASDLSPDMLEVAKSKFADPRAVEFIVADMQNLPFADHSFDAVVCQFGIMFPPNKQKAFEEAHRVLKPGGMFHFSTWEQTDRVPILKLIFNDHIIPWFAGEDPNRFLVPFSLHDPKQLAGFLETANFRESRVERVVLQGVASTAKSLVDGFFRTHAIGQEIYDRDPAAFESIAGRMEAAIADEFSDNPVVCELAAFFGSGIR